MGPLMAAHTGLRREIAYEQWALVHSQGRLPPLSAGAAWGFPTQTQRAGDTAPASLAPGRGPLASCLYGSAKPPAAAGGWLLPVDRGSKSGGRLWCGGVYEGPQQSEAKMAVVSRLDDCKCSWQTPYRGSSSKLHGHKGSSAKGRKGGGSERGRGCMRFLSVRLKALEAVSRLATRAIVCLVTQARSKRPFMQ